MAKAVKTASGKYRCRVYDSNLKKQVSFTCESKKEAERKAAMYTLTSKKDSGPSATFSSVAESFFRNRSEAFSPNSLREYMRIYSHDLQRLYDIPIDSITQEDLQALANDLLITRAPRTVRNIIGLAVSIIHSVEPGRSFYVKVGRKIKPEVKMPPVDAMKALMAVDMSDDMRMVIQLAVYCGMRRGEICALEASDLDGDVLHISKSLAQAPSGEWVVKAPKTAAGDRYITVPHVLAEQIRQKEGRIVKISPFTVTNDFPRIAKRAGVDITLHQLRHWSASYLHDQGVPEAEILKRFGWSQGYVFHDVYRHNLNMDKSTAAIERLASD